MKVKVGNTLYIVKWTHGNNTPEIDGFRACECSIWEGDVFYGLGFSWCHPNDNYNKETGRKLSLTNALKESGFNRETRTMFWKAYFNRKGVTNEVNVS
jgi:hypothetical protein